MDWCSTGFKWGITRHEPVTLLNVDFAQSNTSVLTVSNSTAVDQVLDIR